MGPLLVVAALGLVTSGRRIASLLAARRVRPTHHRAPIGTRANPVPLAQEVEAGPWRLTVTGVTVGRAARGRPILASADELPANGRVTVAVRVRARNAGAHSLRIDGDDFAVTGRSGLVQRFARGRPPEPVLDGTVLPGKTIEGWIVVSAPKKEKNLLLVFDSLAVPGAWSERVFSLGRDSTGIPDRARPHATPNAVGTDPTAPAPPRTRITTASWRVALLDVVPGSAVGALYHRGDCRTTRFGEAAPATIPRWLALRVEVENVRAGGAAEFFPPTAIVATDERGDPLPDILTLTPPHPDVSGSYYPGASREGWVVLALPSQRTAGILRFRPYHTDPDPRFLAWDQGWMPARRFRARLLRAIAARIRRCTAPARRARGRSRA